jgi:hypothetical protein
MKLVLLGLAWDRKRLEQLAARISGLGHEARFQAFRKAQNEAFAEDVGDGAETLPDRSAEIVLHCWTRRSVGVQGKAFQDRAVDAKKQGHYRGLICDDVAIPAAVADAIDFKLPSGAAAEDEQAMRDLVHAMAERLARPQWSLGAIGRALERLEAFVRRSDRLNWVVRVLIFGGIITTVGFVADGKSLVDWFNERPTAEQEQRWRTIEAGDSCEAFTGYIDEYGLDAPYAENANYRRSLAAMVEDGVAADPLPLDFTIPLSSQPFATLDAARADVRLRAPAIAARACAGAVKALGGGPAPPKIELLASPDCAPRNGGYVCRASGVAECPTTKPIWRRVCRKSAD